MFYEETREKELRDEVFRNPGSAYRGAPFWAWNSKLDKEELVKQVSQFKEMGFGGFHIHCRVGLDSAYLGEDFFACVKACEEEAKREGLFCYLYDEDRWPSGSAGGLVTKEQKYRTRFLVFSPAGYEETQENAYMAAAKAVRSQNRKPLAYYKVALDGRGCLKSFERLREMPEKTEDIWEAFLEISGDTPWFNNQAYVNTMDEKAIRRFLDVTHERYFQELGDDFGTEIRSIFTDEPQTTHMGMARTPFERKPIIMPYTDDFDESFQAVYGYSVLDFLPFLFFESENTEGYQVRYHYHAHVLERFSKAFCDQIGIWCREHGILLTGHMLNEWTLHSQTLSMGESMRPMKEFGIPGIDMLCDRREYSTLKQAASVARQQGREGVMSEIYGVTGWGFDFRNHKLAGDWQAALGVTFRVPHLTWASMEGEAKRDYPACIGRHSPWYREYRLIEDHFARLNTALTRGKAKVNVGVIHPVESCWMYWGNKEQTSLKRQMLEENFSDIIEWLLFGLIDFDFISEAMLAQEEKEIAGRLFPMGKMAYHTIVVPGCITLRSTTLERLEKFAENGGRILFLGNAPQYVNAVKSDRGKLLADRAEQIPFNRAVLLEALEQEREIDIDVQALDGEDPTRMKHREEGNRASNLCYQIREDGETRWLFISHVNKPVNEHITWMEQWNIRIKGEYRATVYDTLTGEQAPMETSCQNGNTLAGYVTSQHGSLLMKLTPQKAKNYSKPKEEGSRKTYLQRPEKVQLLAEPKEYRLLEENCCMLDQAEYAWDNGGWKDTEELLRIDNLFRAELGYPQRMEALAQPWTEPKDKDSGHVLTLRFAVESEIFMPEIQLAMEHPEQAEITWNGKKIPYADAGFYVDESIRKCVLPELKKGKNELLVAMPFGRKTNVEWMYLLGNFGTRTAGRKAVLTSLPEKLFYGDYTRQNLSFYGGSLEYTTELFTEEGELILEVSHYRGALIRVYLDGEDKGALFLAPYRKSLGHVKQGRHEMKLCLYGNRMNSFGAVHNADAAETWYGPNLWRTQGSKWSYEYQLSEMGILTSPVWWLQKEK